MVEFYGKCRYIYHTWILWVIECFKRNCLLMLLVGKGRCVSAIEMWVRVMTRFLRVQNHHNLRYAGPHSWKVLCLGSDFQSTKDLSRKG